MRTLRTVAPLVLVLGVAAPAVGGDLFLVGHDAAIATFEHVDGCISTTVLTAVSEQLVRQPPRSNERSAFLTLVISRFDRCTGADLGTKVGSDFMSDFTFDVNQTVDQARLIGSVTVFDPDRVASVVSVDLVWAGSGELTRTIRRSHFRVPGSMFVSRITGLSRDASASGTVLDGGINLVPLPSLRASISTDSSGTISTGRP